MTPSRPHGFWDEIDGVLVVNLDSRPERWRDVRTRAAGLIPAAKLHRLPATAGVTLPGFGKAPWFRGRKRDRTWAGRAGCALSHRAAIQHARERGWRSVLILEDDIEFTPALNDILSALSGTLRSVRWDVCYLGFTDPVSPFRQLAQLSSGHRLYAVTGCSTTHAYVLRDSTYDLLLKKLPTVDGIWSWISRHRAIDRWYYRNLARHFEVCAVSPALIDQQAGFSDITQRAHEKTHSTRIPATRHGSARFRLARALRWLQYRLAEPRDWLRGRIKQLRGF